MDYYRQVLFSECDMDDIDEAEMPYSLKMRMNVSLNQLSSKLVTSKGACVNGRPFARLSGQELDSLNTPSTCHCSHLRWCGGQIASLGELGFSIGGVISGFSHVEIMPDDATGRRVFSRVSLFPRPCIPSVIHPHLASPTCKAASVGHIERDILGVMLAACSSLLPATWLQTFPPLNTRKFPSRRCRRLAGEGRVYPHGSTFQSAATPGRKNSPILPHYRPPTGASHHAGSQRPRISLSYSSFPIFFFHLAGCTPTHRWFLKWRNQSPHSVPLATEASVSPVSISLLAQDRSGNNILPFPAWSEKTLITGVSSSVLLTANERRPACSLTSAFDHSQTRDEQALTNQISSKEDPQDTGHRLLLYSSDHRYPSCATPPPSWKRGLKEVVDFQYSPGACSETTLKSGHRTVPAFSSRVRGIRSIGGTQRCVERKCVKQPPTRSSSIVRHVPYIWALPLCKPEHLPAAVRGEQSTTPPLSLERRMTKAISPMAMLCYILWRAPGGHTQVKVPQGIDSFASLLFNQQAWLTHCRQAINDPSTYLPPPTLTRLQRELVLFQNQSQSDTKMRTGTSIVVRKGAPTLVEHLKIHLKLKRVASLYLEILIALSISSRTQLEGHLAAQPTTTREAAGIVERRMEGARVCEAELVASSSHQTALARARSTERLSSLTSVEVDELCSEASLVQPKHTPTNHIAVARKCAEGVEVAKR
ncbi:hypothetical protein PR048_032050 [Dryococelus australis]|uniref:Uncharacterized protein n=1 Tax=Dryococelus australis TaxID=614101 RepID=A0ABQ9G2B4_9NEOP|nr:hypothetical protein PR048_032050 [Dryococelus australis]